ncbi:MAG: transposase [Methanobrevibacter sp.]|jgi:putative transposase|nr:transposase [Candidatus Methanovirga aequatorialis]
MKYSKPIPGKIISGTVSVENNKSYISITTEEMVQNKPKTGKIVGVDLGLKDVATLSTGFKTSKIQLKELDDKIKRHHQILSKKIKDGCNWCKVKGKLSQLYSDKKNKIQDKLNKLTTYIISEFDEVYVGDVNSQLGLKNKKLSKVTSDAHWYEIKKQLQYKAEWYGKKFEMVDEKYTSQTCHNCKHQFKELKLNIRTWTCSNCGTINDRDINAAVNIRTVGTTGIAFNKTSIS